jgi:hypothetical protein
MDKWSVGNIGRLFSLKDKKMKEEIQQEKTNTALSVFQKRIRKNVSRKEYQR